MSVANSTSRVSYTLTSTTQTLAVPFYFLADADLQVIKQGATPVTLTITTNYTVAGAGVEAGGSITLTGTGVIVGDVLTIKRNMELTQPINLVLNDRLPSTTIERMSDRSTMQIQQLNEVDSRALRFEEGEVFDGKLLLSSRKGKVIAFDETTGDLEYIDAVTIDDVAAAAAAAELSAAEASASAAAAAAMVISGEASLQVGTIAGLKALSVTGVPNSKRIQVLGYHAVGDGGGGLFYYDSASSTTDNGGTVIQPTTGTGRWKRTSSERVNVRWFGAKGDGATNDTAAVTAAITWANAGGGATIFFPRGTFKCNVTLDSNTVDLLGDGADSILTNNNASLPLISVMGIPSGSVQRRGISKLSLIGPAGYASNTLATGIYINGWAHGPISNCTFKNFYTAIYSQSSEWHEILVNRFESCVAAMAFVTKATDIYGNVPLFAQHPTAGNVSFNWVYGCEIAVFIDSDYWKNGLSGTDCGGQLYFCKNDVLDCICGVVVRNGTRFPTQPLVIDTCWFENIGVRGASTVWQGVTYNTFTLDSSGGCIDIRSQFLFGKFVFTDGCLVNYFGCQVVGLLDINADTIGNSYGLNVDSLNTGQAIWWAKCADVYDYRIAQGTGTPNSTLVRTNRASYALPANGLTNLVTGALGTGVWGTNNGQTSTTPTVAGFKQVIQLSFPVVTASELFINLPYISGAFNVVTFMARRLSGTDAEFTMFSSGFSGAKMRLGSSWAQYSFVFFASASSDYWRFAMASITTIQIANICITPLASYNEARELACAPVYIAFDGGLLSATATLNFPSIAATGGTQSLTVTVTGAAVGDVVSLGLPAAPDAGVTFDAWVSAPNTVTIRATNTTAGAIDPVSESYVVTVIKSLL